MPREHNLCCNSPTENCSQMKGIHVGDQASIPDQTSAEKKKSLGRGDARSLKQSVFKKGAKKQKKQVHCAAPCGDQRKQQENVNMNRQCDAALGRTGETIRMSQKDIIGQCCVAGMNSDGHNEAEENVACSKRELHTMSTKRGKLSSAKSHMKKLVQNTRKITVFEPREVYTTPADVNANKTTTDNTKSDISSRVIKKHKTPNRVDKGKKKDSLILQTTDSVPEADNEGYLSETSFKAMKVNSNTGVSQDLKLTKQSKSTHRNSATLGTSHQSTHEDFATPEKHTNINADKTDKEDRIQPLSKQGTFLVEKPKMAWSSPTVRSKFPHSSSGSDLQMETLVTCLQSPASVTVDSGEDGRNEVESQAISIKGTANARDEQSRSLHGENRMRHSYSHSSDVSKEDDSVGDDVGDDDFTMDEDSEEDSEADIVKEAEDISSPWTKEKSNIPYTPLSWATTTNDQKIPSSTIDTTASQDQDVDSKNCSTDQKKPKKMSRLKKIKKSFAKLPKGFSENFLNILPSSSIFLNKPKFRGSKGGKVNVTEIPADDKELKSTGDKCKDETGAVLETVTMRHASMQTNQKKSRAATNENLSQNP